LQQVLSASALVACVTAFWIAVPSPVALMASIVATTTTAKIRAYSTKV